MGTKRLLGLDDASRSREGFLAVDECDKLSIHGRLFPLKLGGLGVLSLAHSIREQGAAQMVVRGDGLVLGWFVITDISEAHTYLSADGVGQLIEVTVDIERADKPSQQEYFSQLMNLAP